MMPEPKLSEHRLLAYCQDTSGLGHLRRATNILTALHQIWPNLQGLITTRTTSNFSLFTLPTGCDIFKLPTQAIVGYDIHGELRTLTGSEDFRYQLLRRELISITARVFSPHLLLVDNEPAGLQEELMPALRELRSDQQPTATIFGLRDIRGSGEHVRNKWMAQRTYRFLMEYYDRILIYGEPEIFDVAYEFALPPTLSERLHYCGYICHVPQHQTLTELRETLSGTIGIPKEIPLVVVLAGSGADGFTLMHSFIKQLPQLRGHQQFHSVIVTGPLMPEEERNALAELVANDQAISLLTTADTPLLMAAANAIICRGGYNSICEALALGKQPIVIPRVTRSQEQHLRAKLFADRDWCITITEASLNSGALVDALHHQLKYGNRLPAIPFDLKKNTRRALDVIVPLLGSLKRGGSICP